MNSSTHLLNMTPVANGCCYGNYAHNNNWSQADLRRLNDARAETLIPAMVLLTLYMVVGVVGNSLVCYVFGFKLRSSTQNVLIVCLAVFDLLSCLISIPTDIVDMRLYYVFPSEAACKVLRMIMAFTSEGSILTLLVIAVDRYRKICRPLGCQMDARKVKLSLVLVLFGAVFFSWPALAVFGLRTIDSGIPGFPGHDCSISDTVKDTGIPLAYTAILFVVFVFLCVCLVVIYSSILIATRRHGRYMKSKSVASLQTSPSVLSDDPSTSDPSSQIRDRTSSSPFRPTSVESAEANQKTCVVPPPQAIVEEQQRSSSVPGSRSSEIGIASDDNHKAHAVEIRCKSGRGRTKQLETDRKDIDRNTGSSCKEELALALAVDSDVGCKSALEEETSGFQVDNTKHRGDDDDDVEDNIMELNVNTVSTCDDDNDNCDDSDRIKRTTKKSESNGNDMFTFKVETNTFPHPNGHSKETISNTCSSCNSNMERRVSADINSNSTTKVAKKGQGKAKNKMSSLTSKFERKTTIIAFMVTLVFILSFLPYLCLQVTKQIIQGFDYNRQGASLVFYNIFLRSYYINSIANPLIYGVLNVRFRQELGSLVSRIRQDISEVLCKKR